jgi:hypothetical protein
MLLAADNFGWTCCINDTGNEAWSRFFVTSATYASCGRRGTLGVPAARVFDPTGKRRPDTGMTPWTTGCADDPRQESLT